MLKPESVSQVSLDRTITCKVSEAKNLTLDKVKLIDSYVVVNLDKREEKTPLISGNSNPFWGEEFIFDDVPADFRQLSATVYHKQQQSGDVSGDKDQSSSQQQQQDIALGQVFFPRALVTSGNMDDDQWFALSPVDVENCISGDLRVRLTYSQPKMDYPLHTVSVNVMAARNLMPRNSDGSCNVYVVAHLLPDLRVRSTQKSKIVHDTSPTFNEIFIFSIDELKPEHEIHLSVWHQDARGEDVFMGHSSIPLSSIVQLQRSDKWYTLLPKPGHISDLYQMMEKYKKKRSSEAITKPKMFALALQTADLEAAINVKNKKPHKFVDSKLNSLSYCGHCSGIMWSGSSQMQCKECRVSCHVKCSKYIASNCGTLRLIRMKVKYSVTPVLKSNKYSEFLQVIAKHDFLACNVLGKVVQEREEAAKLFVSIFEDNFSVIPYIKSTIANEFKIALDAQTLFRANSLASKNIDVYQKVVGIQYLKSTLGPIIKNIVQSNKACEVDPTRLKKGDNLDMNWKNLLGYMNAIVHAIFSTQHNLPDQMREIYVELSDQALRKFPTDNVVKFTAVAGFLFLRMFAPAILGPKLFGIIDEYTDDKTSRTLTLLAKTLQNLANLVEFGAKEPYMTPMNEFIRSKMPQMKQFLNDVSSAAPPVSKRSSMVRYSVVKEPLSDSKKAQILARLYEFFVKYADKMLEKATEQAEKLILRDLYIELARISDELQSQRKKQNGSNNDSAASAAENNPNLKVITSAMDNTPQFMNVDGDQSGEMSEVSSVKSRTFVNPLPAAESNNKGNGQGSGDKAPDVIEIQQQDNNDRDTPLSVELGQTVSLIVEEQAVVSPHTPSRSERSNSLVGDSRNSRIKMGRREFGSFSAQDAKSHVGSLFADFGTLSNRSSVVPQESLAVSDKVDDSAATSSTGPVDSKEQPAVALKNQDAQSDIIDDSTISSSVDQKAVQDNIAPSGIETYSQQKPTEIQKLSVQTASRSAVPQLSSATLRVIKRGDSSQNQSQTSSAPVSPVIVKVATRQTVKGLSGNQSSQDNLSSSTSQQSLSSISLVASSPIDNMANQQSPPISQVNQHFPTSVKTQPSSPVVSKAPADQKSQFMAAADTLNQSQSLPASPTYSSPVIASVRNRKGPRSASPGGAGDAASREKALAQLQAAMGTVSVASAGQFLNTCAGCSSLISETKDQVSAFGKYWHAEHFQCAECKLVLSAQANADNTAAFFQSQLYCQRHNPSRKPGGICARCDQDIVDAALEAMDKKWHKECFFCAACGDDLTSAFVPFEGLPYCKDDYYRRAGLYCGACGEIIDGQYTTIFDRKYHLDCKKCDHCGTSLAGKHYFAFNGGVVCLSHREELLSCRGCHQPIQSQVLVAMKAQYRYHADHFNCTKCDSNLSRTQYYERNENPYCQQCWLTINLQQTRF
ncbi:hypothetical protein MIR68_000333 [Amoeboaphelidium protococcarum]|nr:hypothetical protein MIR68_000333 [Amoeboaphelidium protococcarum]